MKCLPLPTGYTQLVVSNHKRGINHIAVRVYKQVFIYLATYGEYNEGYEIDHIDRDKSNDNASNLRAVPIHQNHANRSKRTHGEIKPIRAAEIKQIRELHRQNLTQSKIAMQLGLNRVSVRYIIKKIDKGEKLKYE